MKTKSVLVFTRFKLETLTYDKRILEFLKSFKNPVPATTIAAATGMSIPKTNQRLKQLERYGIVKKKCTRRTPFYLIS